MKIFDCFMYFDEDLVLELRLNFLSKFVDQFIIVESKFNHKGEKRELKFDLKNFKNFENKITYINLDIGPEKIYKISPSDTEKEKDSKYISNSAKRENFQRNQIIKGLNNAHENDWILVSDIDEIPYLKNIDLKKI